MKILHIVTLAELGGAQSVVLNLSKAASEEGHQVMVASSLKGDLWSYLPDKIQKWPIKALRRDLNFVLDLRVLLELQKIKRKFKPDVVHLHSSKIGMLGRLAFSRKRTIYTVHGFDSVRVQYRKFLFLERLLQFMTARIVAVSNYDLENLRAENISQNVSLIYNGIEDYTTLPVSNGNPNDPPSLLTKSKTSFIVLCIARLARPKRFDIFREVASMMADDKIQFYWVGNKEQVSNLPPNLSCLGEIQAAYELLPSCDLLLLPSDYEGLPISILEALCFSIPVIASKVGGIGEIVNGKNGFAVKNDPHIFVKHILHYKKNSELLSEAKIQARASYLNSFTVQKMYSAYSVLYEDILKSNQKQAIN